MTPIIKYILIINLCYILPASAQPGGGKQPKDGPVKFYFTDGTVSSEGSFQNGKPVGYWKTYYPGGILKSEGNRNGTDLDGVWKFFNESGTITAEYEYRNNVKEGIQKDYYSNGKLASVFWMRNNLRDSVSLAYDEDGHLNKKIYYVNGLENGQAFEYASDNRIVLVTQYRNGFVVKNEKINRFDKFGFRQGPWREFYSDETIHTEGNYKEDRKNGVWRTYSKGGSLLKMEVYKDGELIVDEAANVQLEIERKYHNNGRPKSSVNLINGLKEGVYRDFDREGKTTAARLFERDTAIAEGGTVDEGGRQQGHWRYFWRSGQPRAEGDFLNGKRNGPWTFYYQGSAVQQKGNYKDNMPDGKWIWYYQSGAVLREEIFISGKEEGFSKELDENGKPIVEGSYKNGLKDSLWKYNNGEYIAEGSYVEGNQDGPWKQWFRNGKLAFEGEYFEGTENGLHRYYFDNGQVREERVFRLGLREGLWKYYDVNGDLLLTITFQSGIPVKYDGIKPQEE